MTIMKKLMYIQPSIEVTEMIMTHTLCESPGGGSGFGIITDGETDEQI